jgi:outer membrane murein-binding lipoprotein Lpp
VLKKGVLLGGALVFLVAVLAAGCADDEALSKEQYVSKLNAMCDDFSQKEKEIGEPQTLADLVEKGPLILDAFEKAIVDKVRNLKAPDEIAVQADRLVELADHQRDVIAGLIEAAKENDFAKVRELASKNEALNREAKSITRKLGAEGCAAGRFHDS